MSTHTFNIEYQQNRTLMYDKTSSNQRQKHYTSAKTYTFVSHKYYMGNKQILHINL
jgi:hypothetical protein